LKAQLRDGSQVIEIDAHINDESFVKEGVNHMLRMLDGQA